jgi:hypothetical protein
VKPASVIRLVWLLACFMPAPGRSETERPGGDRQVVVIVWDGMRPDFVAERNTPTLWKLAQEGVTFQHHHSVYLTATNVNGAAIATGVYPNRNSLLANREFRAAIDPQKPFENAEWSTITKADEVTGGKYIAAPTIAETVRASGRRVAIVGTKAVAFLHDRHAEWTSGSTKDFVRFAAAPMSAALREEMVRLLGPFVGESVKTGEQRNTYATRALTEIMWRDALPAFSLLWLSEPDLTQHEASPGAEVSLATWDLSSKLSRKRRREQPPTCWSSQITGSRRLNARLIFQPSFEKPASTPASPLAGLQNAASSSLLPMAGRSFSTSSSTIGMSPRDWWNGCSVPISPA